MVNEEEFKEARPVIVRYGLEFAGAAIGPLSALLI
jgi:hypothetical protein